MKNNPIRILLIEDDEDDFFLIRDLLSDVQGSTYEIERADTYESAVHALSNRTFDICILDYRLGAHTGLEVLAKAKDLRLLTPLIVLTGHGDTEVDVEAMEAGAADYLIKDRLTSEILARAIRYAIKQNSNIAALKEQKENFKTLFNSTFEAVLVHKDGRIIDANEIASQMFRLSNDELIGRLLGSFLKASSGTLLEEVVKVSNVRAVELEGDDRVRGRFPVEISTRRVRLKGLDVSLTAIRDLRERKQMEAQLLQQDRLASIGVLASSLAHEIGTPMGVIRGRAEMVARSCELESVRGPMELIISQIDRISKLMNSVLQLARGKQTAQPSEVALRGVLDDVLQLLSHEFSRKGIALNLRIENQPLIRGETGPLGQVFLNLLVNAIQSIGEAKSQGRSGDHSIDISAVDLGEELEICVSDTGVGIAKENLESLFKPFFTTKPIGSGTGLGLAICYKILQSWDGSIRAENNVSRGASFVLRVKNVSASDKLSLDRAKSTLINS